MTRASEATRYGNDAEVSKRLEPYLGTLRGTDHVDSPALDELAERTLTLVAVMPPRQHRETIERLVAPDDPERGRRVVDALIGGELVAEDERGCLLLL